MTAQPFPFTPLIADLTDLPDPYVAQLHALVEAYAEATGMAQHAAAGYDDGYYVGRAEAFEETLAGLLNVCEADLQAHHRRR